MLIKLFSILAVAMQTVSTKDFCPTGSAPFYRDHGYALVGHVITTLPLFIADCMIACEENLMCFSINVYRDQHGVTICDLNQSNKKQKPESFVRMSGYEYAEQQVKRFCVKNDCPRKEALPDDWFYFNSSFYKIIFDKKTWQDSRQYCQTNLGGDLASIASETEHKYIEQLVMKPAPFISLVRFITDLDYPRKTLSLFKGTTMVSLDDKPALLFDGLDDCATVPSFPINKRFLTFGVWIKTPNPERTMYIFSDYNNSMNASFRLYIRGSKFVSELYTETNMSVLQYVSVSSIPANVLVHIAFTFNKGTRTGKIYMNGILDSESSPSVSERVKGLFLTMSLTYYIGQDQFGQNSFSGWIRFLTVVDKLLEPDQVKEVKDETYLVGAWIGLNDITSEGTNQWISGMPFTYQPSKHLTNYVQKDCAVMFKKNGKGHTSWRMEDCVYGKALFICEKH